MANPGAWGRDRATCLARLRRITYLGRLGWDPRQVAAELGLTRRTVNRYRRLATTGGWVPFARGAAPEVSPEAAAEVVWLYGRGLPQHQVASKTGLPAHRVRRVLMDQGVPIRTRAETVRVARGARPRVEPAHTGTRTSYNGGCRCVPCTEANAAHMRAWRAARRAAG